MTISERINGGECPVFGKLARLGGTVYERRGDGGWRRVKDQERGLRQVLRAERQVIEDKRRAEGAARTAERIEAALAAKRAADLGATVSARFIPRGAKEVAAFIRAAERMRRVS